MTRKFTFLMTAMALIFAMMTPREAWGQTSASIELCTSWDKTLAYATEYTQDYTIDDLNDGTTTLTLGVQGVFRQSKTDTYFQMNKKPGYFKNTTKMPGKITKIETTWNNAKGATKCFFATNAAASSSDETVTVTAATSVTYTPPTDADYYYFNIDVSTGSGSAQMTSCVVYYEKSTTPSKTLTSIAVSGTPTKTTYEAGESFDPAGLVVTGTYDDESQETITSGITWNVTPNPLTAGTTSVSVTATVSEITSAAYVVNDLTVNQHVVTPGIYDIFLNNALYGISTGNNATEQSVTTHDITVISGCTSSASSKTYYDANHIRYYADSYLKLSVPFGYEITSVVFTADGTWNGNITSTPDTYNADTKTWSGNSQTVDFAFGAQNRASKITVTFVAKKTLQSIAVKTPPTKTTYNVGETFDPAGLVITATYDEGDPEDIAYADNESDFSFSPTLETALTTANENVTITYGGKSVDQAITVTLNKLATPANLQATNVTSTSATLTWDAVANASSYEVNVLGDNYDETFTPTTNSLLVEGLTASTEYLWSVKAIGDNVTYSDGDANEDGDFTTLAPPAEAYTVYFNGNNHGTPASESIKEEYPGAGITLPNCTADEHFMFLGWAEDEMATEPSAGVAGGTYYPANDVTLFAVNKYVITVTYVAVNGDAPQAAIVEPGSSITLGSVEDVDCNEWQFAGWSESESSTVAPTLLAGAEYTPIDNVTLYAVYKKQTGSGTTDYTLQYDTWTYSGTTTDKSSYRLFGDDAYIESNESHDLSNVTAVKITMRTFGGTDYKNVNIEDASGNVWGNAAATGKTLTEITATKTNGLTGNGKLRIKSKSGNGTSTGVGISKVVYTVNNTSYTYSTDPDCSTPVATPTITPNGGEFIGSQEITLACTTEGATISYTTDDWTTSSTYSAPFTITETTTIKVKATKDGMSESEEASATFTKVPVLETIQEIFDASATAGNYYVKLNNWVVSGVKGSNAYVTDGTKGFIVYKSGHGFEVGNILSGTAQLALTRYNGAAKFTNLTSTTEGISVTTGGTITPTEVSIADLSGVNTGAVIIASNVIYTGSDIFSDGTNTIKAYNTFMTLPSFTNGDSYNLTGVYIQYNTTKEIAPRSAADIQLIVAAPTFTPEGGDYNAAQIVEITSATSGVEIYYTTDGNDPTVESTLYSAPIELTSNTTLKAIAAKAGSVSEIATAVYTITITTVATPTFEPEGGSYFNESLEVSLDCATDGATIVYTTDNWATQNNYTAPFTITETTTVKAKATKTGMDESEIAEATYTKRYKVDYVVNGDGSAVSPSYITPEEALGTLPTATAPNGYTFRGWNAGDVALTDVEPTYVTAETVPTGNMTLKAVFAIAEEGGENALVKMVAGNTLNNGDKIVIVAHETTVALYQETVSSSYVNIYTFDNNFATIMGDDKNWLTVSTAEGGFTLGDATNGYLYSSGNNLYIGETAQTWTLSDLADGTFKIQSGERNLSYRDDLSNKYWRMGGASYGTSGQTILDIYKVSASSVVYTNFCTSVTALSGNLAEAMTEAGNAYYISTAAYVPANATVTINGVLTNTNADNLIIEDGGQLIVNNSGVQATVKKNIAEANTRDSEWSDWYTISSPLANSVEFANVENLIPTTVETDDYDLYRLDEKYGIWENARVTEGVAFTTIDKGRGYLYARKDNAQLAFAGEINVADVECTLTNGATNGFNLIGNPFSQNIKLTDVKSDGTTELAEGFYVLNNDNTWGAKLTDSKIKPLQGFLVQATEAGTARISKPTAAPSKGERSEQNTNIEMIVSNSIYRDNAFAMFGEGIGLNKVSHRNAEAPMLYVPQDGENFAIAFMDENTTIFPVSFKAMTTGSYSISLKATDNISTLVLVDNQTGTETNMLLEGSYSFIGSPADNDSRFTVKLSISHSNGQADNEHFVYQNGSELVVNGEGTLQIFDVLGRVVISEEVHGQTVYVGGLTTGAYIVRMTGNEVKTQKIIIR